MYVPKMQSEAIHCFSFLIRLPLLLDKLNNKVLHTINKGKRSLLIDSSKIPFILNPWRPWKSNFLPRGNTRVFSVA